MEQATIGRIVHYVLPEGTRSPGEHRPAIVVRVWPNEYPGAEDPDGVNLQVFTDDSNDALRPTEWKTSIKHDEETQAVNTWHWPERA